MKKNILISILAILHLSSFSQKLGDTIKTKSTHYLLGFSVYPEVTYKNFTNWMLNFASDVSLGINIKRHTLLTGAIGGPNLILRYQFNDNNSISKVDYLSFYQNWNRWGIYGGYLSYQFQFNNINKPTKNNLKFYLSYSRYKNVHNMNYISDYNIYIKNMFKYLVGYSFSHKVSNKLNFEFSLLTGIVYYIDRHIFPNDNTLPYNVTHKTFYKFLPETMLKFDISYIIKNK